MPRTEPIRGDLLEIRWVDIHEDSVGDPNSADLARRTSFGLFWDRVQRGGIECLVTTTTLDNPDQVDGQNGWCIYPLGCITGMKIVRRVRQPRVKSKSLKSVGEKLTENPI